MDHQYLIHVLEQQNISRKGHKSVNLHNVNSNVKRTLSELDQDKKRGVFSYSFAETITG